jgi:hypothetical protein
MKHCSHIQPSPNVLAQEEHVNSYFYKILIKNRKKKKMNPSAWEIYKRRGGGGGGWGKWS